MPVDPRHGRFVPSGQELARLIHSVFQRIGHEVVSSLMQLRAPDVGRWVATLAEYSTGTLASHFAFGMEQSRLRVRVNSDTGAAKGIARHRRHRNGDPVPFRTKREPDHWMFRPPDTQPLEAKPPTPPTPVVSSPPGGFPIITGFDVLLPQVRNAVSNLAFEFAQSTLDTSMMGVTDTLNWLRASLDQGISHGDAIAEISRRVFSLFGDPGRALTIAQTETSRAMHAGQLEAASQSGVVTKMRWLASTDACPLCMELDGKEVDLGEPFHVDPKGGAYSKTLYPPRHPHCMCAITEVV